VLSQIDSQFLTTASQRAGARLATPGEFTLRAFLNGRLDLLQAESVHAIVSAQTVEAADSALAVLRGPPSLLVTLSWLMNARCASCRRAQQRCPLRFRIMYLAHCRARSSVRECSSLILCESHRRCSSLDFDDDLPPLDVHRVAEQCALSLHCSVVLAAHPLAHSATQLRQEVSSILDSAKRGALLTSGVQVTARGLRVCRVDSLAPHAAPP
jgi:hypothetical protein